MPPRPAFHVDGVPIHRLVLKDAHPPTSHPFPLLSFPTVLYKVISPSERNATSEVPTLYWKIELHAKVLGQTRDSALDQIQ